MKRVSNCRGQSALELMLLFVVVIAALVAGQYYIKHAIEGRLHQSADQVGSQFSFDQGGSTKTSDSHSTTDENTTAEGVTTNAITAQRQHQDIVEHVDKATTLFGN